MEFIFTLSQYDEALFIAQVSKALEQRTALVSRKKCPMLWSYTDKLNARPTATEEILHKRHKRYFICGILLSFVGLFLLVPGLMAPKELLVPLIAGVLALGLGIGYLRYGRESKKANSTSFDQAASTLFHQYKAASPQVIKFFCDKICLTQTDAIDYKDLERIFISGDLLILFYNERILILQKKDLMPQNIEAFIAFLTEKSQNSFDLLTLL